MSSPSCFELAKEWLRLDKNPTTREAIQSLVDSQDEKKLEELLCIPLTFGTAGLRAKMEAGFSRMNDLTVIQASQGLCNYVLEQLPSAQEKGIVVGYDHRFNSERFARLTSAVFLHKGFKVYLYRQLVHTPMVPFGIKKLNAACGVMITASHNPKQDNGFKVYWENACQIVEPHDAGIAHHITLNQEPWTWDVDLCDFSELCSNPHSPLWVEYFTSIGKLSHSILSAPPKFVYTPMHGVGGPAASNAFKVFGLPKDCFIPVPLQMECDPEFPTVKFPNPEEKGALDLAMEHAEQCGATFVLANDPDADRFAAAEQLPSGKWYQFTGNQLGTLLAHHIWKQHSSKGIACGMLASAVSSKMLQSMGSKEGFHFEETLTGFKWLGNRAITLENNQTVKIIFAYEEAIGFMVEDIVRDKDGISAMMTFVELASQLSENSLSVYQHLLSLYARYGLYVNANSYYICHDPKITAALFHSIRYGQEGNSTLNFPTSIGPYKVLRVRDLTIGYDSASKLPNHAPDLPVSLGTQMITFQLSCPDGLPLEITIRTSGTEPKIKYYSELSQPCSSLETSATPEQVEHQLIQLQSRLQLAVAEILEELLHPSQYGLVAV
ncbi:hypothetical protein DSO57_1014031 [Entomophthora muscae]|uniref:Uncharacterized protein n=1 Tax=Entomophthora muscae TaxID=34485 RepID=A0ACC2U3J4_9FUNG|nr:hypothetical protein DSO57_1014031 [Entomophthora muscae]